MNREESTTWACWECAFKHLSQARVVYMELRMGYLTDVGHISALIGELAWASMHLVEVEPDLANQIRDDRGILWDHFVSRPGEDLTYVPPFELYLEACLSRAQRSHEAAEDEIHGEEEEDEVDEVNGAGSPEGVDRE